MPKISVIIPIYNVEKHIERCARSLFEQTMEDMEFIFVDDCSPDKSVAILKTVLKEYPHRQGAVKIIAHEKNKGLTTTRNTGIALASGDYIAHCDSDDWVAPEMYRQLYSHAIATNSDIVYSDFYFAYGDRISICRTADYDSDNSQLLRNYISSVWTSLVNMIVRRTIYERHNLRAPEHISYCEDFWLSVRLFYFAERVTKINKAFYYYNQSNASSIMHNLREYTGDDMRCYLETISFFEKEDVILDYEEVLSWRILNSFHSDMFKKDKHREITAIYPKSHKYILSCPFYNWKQKLFMWLLAHHLRPIAVMLINVREWLRCIH